MPKVNVYLPDDLADAVRAAGLSLSPVCQRAIREELDRMNAQKAVSNVEAVAARLRATVSESVERSRADGREDGMEWAQEWAAKSELEAMAAGDLRWEAIGRSDSPIESLGEDSEFFARRAGGWPEGEPDELEAYWQGFSDGARTVLEAVEPLL